MRYLLDKSVIRRCLRGLLGGVLTDDVQLSLALLTSLPEASLYISLETRHILTHIVKVPQAQFLIERTQVLYPVRYTRRWARRLREMNFGREDAYLSATPAVLLCPATSGSDASRCAIFQSALSTYVAHSNASNSASATSNRSATTP